MTQESMALSWPLVVGLGSPDRGDDAIGPVVARAVEGLGLAGVRVAVHEDPTALFHLWANVTCVVVVDAIMSGTVPGTVVIREVGDGSDALPDSAWAQTGRGGTHAFGLATAVEMARTLGRLPAHVTLVGIEAESFDHGEGLTPRVAGAIDSAVEAVRTVLERERVGSDA
jgi:hydrogenase maturation protease